jgi:alcohol dehydrogenase class IV
MSGDGMPTAAWALRYPPEIRFGPGVLEALPGILPPERRRILLVTGRSAAETLVPRLQGLLAGRDVAVVCGIQPDPPLAEVERIVDVGREHRAEAVVAVGGGSVLDVAKLAAAVIALPGVAGDYYQGCRDLTARGPFLVAAPTTAGSGAEVTPNAVLTDPATGNKRSIRHPALIPDVALVDPVLTLSAPPALTAASGLDALTQAVESCTTPATNAFTRPHGVAGAALLFRHLETAWRDGADLAARTRVAEGSLLAALSFAQTGLGAVHGLAHPLGALLDLPHGLTCAVLLPHILAWNAPTCQEAYGEIAVACGCPDVPTWMAAVRDLARRLGIPPDLAAAGLRPEHFPFVLRHCRSGSMKNNPRPLADAEVLSLLRCLAQADPA